MSDRYDLQDALKAYDDRIAARGPWFFADWMHDMAAAARRVAEAPEVWWCETHGVGHRIQGSPAICAASMNPFDEEEDCRMVRKLLVDP